MQQSFLYNTIEKQVANPNLQSFNNIYQINKRSRIKKWVIAIFLLLGAILVLPWTQNIKAKGYVTTLKQEQRPQELNTIIAGKIANWFVKEGDFVKQGDTILQLSEVKVDYFDPQLLNRTQEQINAKQLSADGYKSKATTASVQANALLIAQQLKLQSLDNKLSQQQLKATSDSIDIIAVQNELSVYQRQLAAGKNLLDSGVISLIDYEKRKVNFQNSLAKKITVENKYAQSKQELLNLKIEKNSVVQEYIDKISKADGDKYSSLSAQASTIADIAKLQTTYASYDARNKLYYITAPQNGQVTKAKKAGIGEVVKEGEMIVEIVPNNINYAIEMYIEPMDLPLVNIGQKVRFVFDGFPAVVFSGWPKNSYGTFGGIVTAVENSVSYNGKFRVLVAPDKNDKPWPTNLKIGGGAQGIALLKNVTVLYELWRNINGFPADYYKPTSTPASK